MKGLFHLYLLFVPRCTSAILHIFSGDEVSVAIRLVFQTLCSSKTLPLRTGGGGGVVSHSDTVVPAQIQNSVV